MKRAKWNNTFSYWKEVGAHNCRLNSSLRMGFGWLRDTHNMTLFLKRNPVNVNEADGTGLNIMKCPLLYINHFFLQSVQNMAFSTYYSNKFYVGVNRYGNLPLLK